LRERTLVLVKPDGVERGLVGEIVGRFERRGLRIVAMKMLQATRELAEEHYAAHRGKPFFDGVVEFMTSGPTVAMVVEGENAIHLVRNMMGALEPGAAAPGTIRGDFTTDVRRNLVHGSDGVETAEREIPIWFHESELYGR
jgi:nucleoside-diphosphate kinase